MPELSFKGKEFVHNHHLTVPHRPLVPDPAKGIGPARLDGNLIIQGDNLHALKSLLPLYAGKVDCIFIDPPYNTGNEGWSYNDNVNSPMLQAWLRENPIGIEDGLRHDKWCAMMWPRLKLLHELLGEAGSFWVTLDDNEVHRARLMLDEIFGEQNFVSAICWANKVSPANDALFFSQDHNWILVYAKDAALWRPTRLDRTEDQEALYTNVDGDERGPWNSLAFTSNKSAAERPNLYYPIKHPNTGVNIYPPEGSTWRTSKEKCEELINDGRLFWGVEGTARQPRLKRFLSEMEGVVPRSVWGYERFGSTQEATLEIRSIGLSFPTPKPKALLDAILKIASDPNSIILDSFAGSGTTAHAVLAANKKDGGDRKFILVECEDYADTLTAERVRRVIEGYAYTGTQREELLKQSITFTDLRRANRLLEQIDSIENLDGHRFDRIDKKVKDGVLTVEGVKAVQQQAEGLGGSFTYCTLGAAVDMDKLLTGEQLPDFAQLGALLFHTATSEALDPAKATAPDAQGLGYLGESSALHVWLIYRPELAFLQSREAALTLTKARTLAETRPGKRHLVFAPAKFVSQKLLDAERIPVDFAPLPWALYRVERI